MSRRRITTIWVIAAVAFVAFAVLVGFLPGWIGLAGTKGWLLRGGLWLLGLVAALAVAWHLHRKAKAAPAAPPLDADGDEIDAAVAAAQRRLVAARAPGGGRIGALPAVLLLGPAGAAKSTMVARSGLDPELLAGELFANDQIVPTRLVNLWFARGVVLAEAGGLVTADAAKRARLLQRLRPQALGAAFGRGAQAPRLAVVCFPCDELVKPGAAETVPAAARQLRLALAEAAEALGIRLPVYVLFTKADRVPGFADYVQTLTRDEVREVLGATLPAAADDGRTVYAERETTRLSAAFGRIFESLAARRLLLLPREHAADRKPGAYEFPREMRKLAPLAVQFLVELGRPSQLAVSQFVRGFYFTGVRAIVVTESAPAAPAGGAGISPPAAGATAVFNNPLNRPAAAAPVAVPSSRKKPQWVFLERLFPDVVLADQAARRATEGGTRVHGLRRAMLAAAALLALFVGGAFAMSWLNNRGLEQRTIAAARATIPPVDTGLIRVLATTDALRRLDSLRLAVAEIGVHEREGAPVRLRWGLYAGDDIYPDARRLYFARFEQLMFGDVREGLIRRLRDLPAEPAGSDEYGPAYDALKAYLITSRHPDRSTSPFLPQVLLGTWLDGREVEGERLSLAKRQFEFYADELTRGDPYRHETDTVAVERGRAFLGEYRGEERIYQIMTSEAGAASAAVHFNRQVPGSAALVVDAYEVPGAFTKGGWRVMQASLGDVGRFLSQDDWVLGPRAREQVDQRAVAASLRERYERDYMQHWRRYLSSGRVSGYRNLEDAAARLQRLGGAQSPLLAMLAIASRHTAVDSAGPVTRNFQPLHLLQPPADTTRLGSEANQPYAQALLALASAAQAAAKPPPGGEVAAEQAIAAAVQQAESAVTTIVYGFEGAGAARVDTIVERLLREPIRRVAPHGIGIGAVPLAKAGADFCASYNGKLLGKFPFAASPTAPGLSLDDLAAIFHPTEGLLWKFYDGSLTGVLERTGNQVMKKPSGTAPVSQQFIDFFNRAAAFGDALYRGGAKEPHFAYGARAVLTAPVTGVTLTTQNGNTQFTGANTGMNPLEWRASANQTTRLVARISGAEVDVAGPFEGPWALFRLFRTADRWLDGGNPTAEWVASMSNRALTTVDGSQLKVAVQLQMQGVPPVLRSDYFDGLRCVARIAP